MASFYGRMLGLIYSYRRLPRIRRRLLRLIGREHDEMVDFVSRPDLGTGFFAHFQSIVDLLPIYERGVLSYLRELFAKGNCLFLDVGAYLGLYTVLAAKMGCNVIAFEPNPISAVLLRRNLEGAAAESRVLVIEKGLWDRDGILPLKLEYGASYLTRLHDSRYSSKRKPKEVPVELTTLDKVYQANKHMFEDKRVIMKVDVEGAALRVVRGGLTMIEERRPYVILEVHRGEGEDDELAAMPYLLKLGYRWRLLERRDTHFPHFMIALEPS